VEGATMARRMPFPLSSIPAYIEQTMKLFVCLYPSRIEVSLGRVECGVKHPSREAGGGPCGREG
jgi:hypothetical protein